MESEPSSVITAAGLQHLKRVSRIKHRILQRYLPPWTRILGSSNRELAYFDCFAGPGQYEMQGRVVDGSPLIALASARDYCSKNPHGRLFLYLVDDNQRQLQQLQRALALGSQLEKNLSVETLCADSEKAIPSLLAKLGGGVPAFVNVDPYGHPLSLSVLNQLLRRPQTELMINLMWYQINRDLNNPSERARIDRLFGDVAWQAQPFMSDRGLSRETAFLDFFKSRLQARFVLEFKIRFDPEDLTRGDRTKYYLVHACNHIKAVNLMKSVMWPLGDEEGTFDYSGSSQGILISETPTEMELREILLRTFRGQTKTYDQIVQQTWQLPFLEKHYRSVLKSMEGNEVTVTRISSKRTGIAGNDEIHFPEAQAIA